MARPASAARSKTTAFAAPLTAAPTPHEPIHSTTMPPNSRLRPEPKTKRFGPCVGALNRAEGAWERTFNCEDNHVDLRDFWALVLEGTSRAKLQVHCAPFVILGPSGEPEFVLYHQRPAEKKAANSSSRSADAGSVACTIVDADSCSVLWAAVQEQIQTWPRVAVKRRIADSGSESGSKALSSTQLLLAQLVSGGGASNPLEVAKSMSHELMPKDRAVNIAAVLARICQKREDEAEAARSVEGSINSRRVKDADGLRVIQARLRDDAGQVIDHSVGDGVAELKCVSLLIAKTYYPNLYCALLIAAQVLAPSAARQRRCRHEGNPLCRCHCCNGRLRHAG
jgi:hypothetical protein